MKKLPCVQWFTVRFEFLVGWNLLLVGSISAMQVRAILERFCRSWRPVISGNSETTAEGARMSWVNKRCGIFLCNQFCCLSLNHPMLLLLGNRASFYLNVLIDTHCVFPTKSSCLGRNCLENLRILWKNVMSEFLSSCVCLFMVLCSLDKLRWTLNK